MHESTSAAVAHGVDRRRSASRLEATRSPLVQRLDTVLRTRLLKRPGRLDHLELVMVHTLSAGAGGLTDWRLRAAIENVTDPRAAGRHGPGSPLSTLDRGTTLPGHALDELWRWVSTTSSRHGLAAPVLVERVQFSDAAAEASVDVIRHRVLRAAAVLERLPAGLDVRSGRRRAAPDVSAFLRGQSALPARARAVAATVPVVRLVARFPAREVDCATTCVVLWADERSPELVALLRQCARRLDPRPASPNLDRVLAGG